MVLRLGPQPDFPTRPAGGVSDPDLARQVAAALAAGASEELIRFQLGQTWSATAVNECIDQAKKNPFLQGAMTVSNELQRHRWVLENQRKAETIGNPERSIPVRHKLAPEAFLNEHYTPLRPAVLTGLVDDWPAITRWNIDYLETKIGRQTKTEVQKGRSSTQNFEVEKLKYKTSIPFGEFADLLRSGTSTNDMYVTANNGAGNRAVFDPVWSDFTQIDGYTKADSGNDGFLWLGPKGTLTPFHHDLTNNLLIQVKGRKKVHMVPTFEDARMKPFQRYFSGWTLEQLQSQKNGPPVYEVDIGPGDALYIPVGWWHHVIGLEESYSVLFTNFVWPNDFTSPYMLNK